MTATKIKSIGDVPYPIDVGADALSPLLTAGAALGITGNDAEESAWLARTSEADGVESVRSIHGRTLRWNQLVSDGATSVTVPTGHKYVSRITVDGTTTTTLGVSTGAAIAVTGGTDNIFDLTAMFGAGSEPATVAEFEAMYPADYYPYDAGSLLPVNMTGIESTAADESWTQQRLIPAIADAFPDGMEGVGDNADTLYEDRAEKRIGTYLLTSDKVTSTSITTNLSGHVRLGIERPSNVMAGSSSNPNFQIANRSDLRYNQYNYNYGVPGDFSLSPTNAIITLDEATVTTIDEAKAWIDAHQPIIIKYPLATPTVTPIDPPLNLTYRTEVGGTERVMVPAGENSAPPTIVAAQGYTAESLRDTALSCIAPVENGLASTNYAVGAYLVHGGQLCKVTTAIATGEAISIGTNVTATTVMAEVIALIAQ